MSYYILPKINNQITIDPVLRMGMDNLSPMISHTLNTYFNNVKENISKLMVYENTYTLKSLSQIINPCEYIYNIIPNHTFSISKLTTLSYCYYDILEIYNTLKLYESVHSENINIICRGKYCQDIITSIKSIRRENNDKFVSISIPKSKNKTDTNTNYNDVKHMNIANKCSLIYFELNEHDSYSETNDYILGLLSAIRFIFLYQCTNGIAIIKINDIYYKPIIDILYIISSLYEKVYIIKPNTNNILSNERYIVCKKYIHSELKNKYSNSITNICNNCSIYKNDIIMESLITNDISNYFINKIEESNIIIGQQQLESYDQIINILKNKNKIDKIENIQKHNIQKCIHWCEKYKIPYHKLYDKLNNVFISEDYDDEYYENSDTSSDGGINIDRLDELPIPSTIKII